MTVSESWTSIEAWLKANAPSIRKSLRPGAKDAAIEKLQSKLSITLPTDFVESVRCHDGQKEDAEHGIFPMADDVLGAMPSCRLLKLGEIASEWTMMKELLDAGEFTDQKSEPQAGVRDDWWNPGWIPIADNGGGDYYCLDMAPNKGGSAGQVIAFFHDMEERPRMATSFAAWVADLAAGLESGRYGLDDDEGIVEVKEDEDEDDEDD